MSIERSDRSSFPPATAFRCAGWYVEPELNAATSDGQTRRLGATLMSLWVALVHRSGHLVTKEELICQVWGGRCVSDDAITVAIYELRKLLGDRARSPRFIETIPGKGYRWLMEVDWQLSSPPSTRSPTPMEVRGDGAFRDAASPAEAGEVVIEAAPMPLNLPRSITLARNDLSFWPWGWGVLLACWMVVFLWDGVRGMGNDRGPVLEPSAESLPAIPAAALDAHLRGLALLREPTPEHIDQAMEELRTAIDLVPDHGPSWAAMAEVCAWRFERGLGEREDLLTRMEAIAHHALELEPDHPGALHAMGLVEMLRYRRWSASSALFERAVALHPTFARGWQELAWMRLAQGDLAAASQAAERSRILQPATPAAVHLQVVVLLGQGRPEASLRALRKADAEGVTLSVDLLGLQVILLMELGRLEEVWPTYLRMLEVLDYEAAKLEELAAIYQQQGFEGVMEHRLRTVPGMPQLWRATQWMWLGQHREALAALQEGERRREPSMMVMAVHPVFRPLHGHPDFERLVDALGLGRPQDGEDRPGKDGGEG